MTITITLWAPSYKLTITNSKLIIYPDSDSKLHQMVRLQFWKAVEHKVHFCYPVHSDLEWWYLLWSVESIAPLAGVVEYTNCTSAEGRLPANDCPGYDTKQSDGEVLVMLGLWGMWSTPLLPLLPGPLWPGMVAPDRVLSMGQIELNCILMLNWIVWIRTVWLNWIAWNRNVFDYQTVYLHLNCLLMLYWIV